MFESLTTLDIMDTVVSDFAIRFYDNLVMQDRRYETDYRFNCQKINILEQYTNTACITITFAVDELDKEYDKTTTYIAITVTVRMNGIDRYEIIDGKLELILRPTLLYQIYDTDDADSVQNYINNALQKTINDRKIYE